MNTGAIATRYARALLRYVLETGNGEKVCAQVRALLADPAHAPSPLEPELQRIAALLVGLVIVAAFPWISIGFLKSAS